MRGKEATTLNDIVKKTGLTYRKVRRELRWWLEERGLDFDEIKVRGRKYALPPEFVDHVEKLAEKERKRRRILRIETV